MARDEEYCGYCFHHVDFPEFTFVRKPEEDWNAVEYFMLASPFFSHPNWWTCYFYYHQTMIYQMSGAYSDHLWIPAPTISTLHDPCYAVPPEDAHIGTEYMNRLLLLNCKHWDVAISRGGGPLEHAVRDWSQAASAKFMREKFTRDGRELSLDAVIYDRLKEKGQTMLGANDRGCLDDEDLRIIFEHLLGEDDKGLEYSRVKQRID